MLLSEDTHFIGEYIDDNTELCVPCYHECHGLKEKYLIGRSEQHMHIYNIYTQIYIILILLIIMLLVQEPCRKRTDR